MSEHKTDYQIKQIMKYNRDGPNSRQQERHKRLMAMVKHLQDNRGYGKRWDVHNIGKKDVHRLLHDWKQQDLRVGTIKNRLADIRWLASKVGRDDCIPSNRELGIGLKKNEPGYGENRAVSPGSKTSNGTRRPLHDGLPGLQRNSFRGRT